MLDILEKSQIKGNTVGTALFVGGGYFTEDAVPGFVLAVEGADFVVIGRAWEGYFLPEQLT